MIKVKVNGQEEYTISPTRGVSTKGKINGESYELDIIKNKAHSFHVLSANKSYNIDVVEVNRKEKTMLLNVNNTSYTLNIKDKYDLLLEKMGMANLSVSKINSLKAPMPGLVIDVMVEGGKIVKKGDPLLVLEAMKMENILKSPTDGVIKKIGVSKSETVDKNQVLVEFE